MKHERLAFDRASVRTETVDGMLKISVSNISKANVSGYLGREIPNAEALGLDPNRMYQLLRDPDELKAAAETFNEVPLLIKHVPITAKTFPKELTVGTVGTNAKFEYPYLTNSLTVWDASAIAGIETEEQKELSSAYRYVADMTPGEFEGVPYDGVMRNIVGNHVALVMNGRAGPDVVVGDELPLEINLMKLKKSDVAIRAALRAYLSPKMAQDSALPEVIDIITKNKGSNAIARAVKSQFSGKLAQDMDIDPSELAEILDLASEGVTDDPVTPTEEPPAQDDLLEQVTSLLGGKVPDEVMNAIKAALSKTAQDDNNPAGDPPADPPAADPSNVVDKPAMDAAISRVRRETLAKMNAIRIAESEVKPLIGDVIAQDSAENVYKMALDEAGVDLTGVPTSAYRPMVKLLLDNKEKQARPTTHHLAMDAAAECDFAKRYPTASKLVRS